MSAPADLTAAWLREAVARGMCETKNAAPCMCGGRVLECVWLEQADAALAAIVRAAGLDATDCRWLGDVVLREASDMRTLPTHRAGINACDRAAALLRALAAAAEGER